MLKAFLIGFLIGSLGMYLSGQFDIALSFFAFIGGPFLLIEHLANVLLPLPMSSVQIVVYNLLVFLVSGVCYGLIACAAEYIVQKFLYFVRKNAR